MFSQVRQPRAVDSQLAHGSGSIMELAKTVFLLQLCSFGTAGLDGCLSPQFIVFGATGLIQCSFPPDTYGIFWYNTSGNIILHVEDTVKGGEGFLSREYDIYPNGSLIVKNVSMEHDGIFTVITLETPTSETESHAITVSVNEKTVSHVPRIDNCKDEKDVCFYQFEQNSEISCTVKNARPQIPLWWVVRTMNGDRNLSAYSVSVVNGTRKLLFTSQITTRHPFSLSKLITLLVCKANDLLGLLEENESQILVLNGNKSSTIIKPLGKNVPISSKLELRCSHSKISYLVWQVMKPSERAFSDIVHAVFVGKKWTSYIDEEYNLADEGSLVVNAVRISHEGVYRCISGNGFEDDEVIHNVTVYVNPSPAYVIVDGCSPHQQCVLDGLEKGNFTCTLKGVRPYVELEFVELYSEVSISYETKTNVKQTGHTFDISLTSHYHSYVSYYFGSDGGRVTIECKAVGSNVCQLHLSRKFDLVFAEVESDYDYEDYAFDAIFWSSVAGMLLIFVTLYVVFYIVLLRRQRLKKTSDDKSHDLVVAEDIPLLTSGNQSAKMDIFVSELKEKYRKLYQSVQPIPYLRNKLHSVEEVFVGGGIEYLATTKKHVGPEIWKKISTYHNILDSGMASTRRVLEGGPGCGKSIWTLKIAYDWCNNMPGSCLENTSLLLLLRLRQLEGVDSIYRAIKVSLLPRDSQVSESDIENILRTCSSVVVVLDGFDEFRDQGSGIKDDLLSIIKGEMFQNFKVILTSRSAHLPLELPAQTMRLKLTGFDDKAREQYIRKVFGGDAIETVNNVKNRLKENPVLKELCRVPLFFALFAHISSEHNHFGKPTSNTSMFRMFRLMISCIFSHMKNKMKNENATNTEMFDRKHEELSKLAYDGLRINDQQIFWMKHDISERLGHDFYDHYVRVGILVEEEVLDFTDETSLIVAEETLYKTKVQFYHKLFCEWYAACYFSDYISRGDMIFDLCKESVGFEAQCVFDGKLTRSKHQHYLKHINPFDHQHVYLFACGMNPTAAEKIISYFRSKDKMFAVLCSLEKKERSADALEDVQEICSQTIVICRDQSLMVRRSTIQLLQVASTNEVSITSVHLNNCYSKVNLTDSYGIELKSSFVLPVISTLKELVIREKGRKITAEDVVGILEYSSKCLGLKALRFWGCLMPLSVRADDACVLRQRNIEVFWGSDNDVYRLNCESGIWECSDDCGGEVMSHETYRKVIINIRENFHRSFDGRK